MPPKRATTAKTAESSKSKKVKQVKTTGRGHKATDIENEKDDINKVANLSSKSKKKGVEDHELEYLNMTVLDKLLTKSKESEPERLLREYKVASEKKNQDSDILIASLLSKVEELEKLNNDLSEQLKQRNVSNGEVAKKQSGKRVNGKIQSNDRNDVEALRKQNILYKDLIKEKDETIDELKVKLEESNASKEELEESCIFKDDFSFLICGLQIHETTTTDTYVIFDCTQTSPSGAFDYKLHIPRAIDEDDEQGDLLYEPQLKEDEIEYWEKKLPDYLLDTIEFPPSFARQFYLKMTRSLQAKN